jgi:hypothetical protein
MHRRFISHWVYSVGMGVVLVTMVSVREPRTLQVQPSGPHDKCVGTLVKNRTSQGPNSRSASGHELSIVTR